MTAPHATTDATTDADACAAWPLLLRVERGCPSPEELAALTAVLLARTSCAAPDDMARCQQGAARWRRPDRVVGFDGPRTWRAAA